MADNANNLPQQEGNDPHARMSAMPVLLRKGAEQFKPEEEWRLFTLSTIAVTSGLLTKVSGVYDQKRVYPNLFLFVIAPPASGKSVMLYSKLLVKKIHETILDASKKAKQEYDRKVKLLKKADNEPPPLPPFQVVLIPANCSGSKLIQHLALQPP